MSQGKKYLKTCIFYFLGQFSIDAKNPSLAQVEHKPKTIYILLSTL